MWMWLLTVAVASPWVEGPGRVRIGLQAASLRSPRQFAGGEARGLTGPRCPIPIQPGRRMPYSCVNGGTWTQRSLTTSAQVGVGRGFAVDVQVPVVAASFEDDLGRTVAAGLADVQGGLRWGRTSDGLAWAAALHIKAPTGPGDFADRDVPLGDGQWDLAAGVRVGWSLHPWGWVEIWQSWAVRLRNPRTGIDPGDEWRPVVAAGFTPVPQAGVLGRVEGRLAGDDRDAFGLSHPGRRLLQIGAAAFARPIPQAWIEIGVAVPVAGRRWPSAPVPYLTLIGQVGPRR